MIFDFGCVTLQRSAEVAFTSALNACQKATSWHAVIELLKHMSLHQVELNAMTYGVYSKAVSDWGDWHLSLEVLKDMKNQEVSPTSVNYSLAISAFQTTAIWQAALLLAYNTSLRDVFLCSVAISVCEEAGEWEAALKLLDDFRLMQVELDLAAYNAAISACEKASAWQRALMLFMEVSQVLQPNVVSCSATIAACQKAGKWQKALRLLSEAKASDTKADVIAHNSAIRACKWQFALLLLSCTRKKHLELNIMSYSAAMCPETCGPWEWSIFLFQDISTSAVESNILTYGSVLAACERADWELATHLATLDGLDVNVVLFNTSLTASQKATAWLQTLATLQHVKLKGLKPDRVSHLVLLTSLVEASDQWSLALWHFHFSKIPDVNLCNAAISACERPSKWLEAMKIFNLMSFRDMKLELISYNSLLSLATTPWQHQINWFLELQRDFPVDVTSCAAVVNHQHVGSLVAESLGFMQRLGLQQVKLTLKIDESMRMMKSMKRFEELGFFKKIKYISEVSRI